MEIAIDELALGMGDVMIEVSNKINYIAIHVDS